MPEPEHKEWNALSHFHQKWNALDGRAREAAAMLDYTQEEWDSGRVTHLFETKGWGDLDLPQKDAAHLLGLTEQKWNEVANNVHKNHPSGLHEMGKAVDPKVLPSPFPDMM